MFPLRNILHRPKQKSSKNNLKNIKKRDALEFSQELHAYLL